MVPPIANQSYIKIVRRLKGSSQHSPKPNSPLTVGGTINAPVLTSMMNQEVKINTVITGNAFQFHFLTLQTCVDRIQPPAHP